MAVPPHPGCRPPRGVVVLGVKPPAVDGRIPASSSWCVEPCGGWPNRGAKPPRRRRPRREVPRSIIVLGAKPPRVAVPLMQYGRAAVSRPSSSPRLRRRRREARRSGRPDPRVLVSVREGPRSRLACVSDGLRFFLFPRTCSVRYLRAAAAFFLFRENIPMAHLLIYPWRTLVMA